MVIPTSLRSALRAVLLSAAAVLAASGCLDDDVTTQPTSTMAPMRPPTTLLSTNLDTDDQESQRVEVHAAPMLDGELHLLRSDDPATPFVDGEPAELLRIGELAMAGDCEQLRGTLEFWLTLADQEDEPAEYALDDSDDSDDSGEAAGPDPRVASVLARAAYDSIVAAECGAEDE